MTMRGPSAGALATLESQLDQSVGADGVGTRKAAEVGDDLFGISQVLRSTPSLRRVLTDASIEGPAKQELVRQLFEGKVDAISLVLLGTAVGRRWTTGRDLADALESRSEIAIVRSAGDNAGRVVDELFAVAQTVSDNPALRDALSDPSRSVDDKAALVDGLLSTKALAATVTLVKQSLAGTYRSVGVALATYQQVAAKVQQQGVATVRVAQPLSAADRSRLEAALTRQYGRPVHLNVRVDPELIGGVRVEIGDDVIDGSVLSRLADARRALAG